MKYGFIQCKISKKIIARYLLLFHKLGWENSVFKIEGGGGPSYLKQTTDHERKCKLNTKRYTIKFFSPPTDIFKSRPMLGYPNIFPYRYIPQKMHIPK